MTIECNGCDGEITGTVRMDKERYPGDALWLSCEECGQSRVIGDA